MKFGRELGEKKGLGGLILMRENGILEKERGRGRRKKRVRDLSTFVCVMK